MNNDEKHVVIEWKQYTSWVEASSDLNKGLYIHDWSPTKAYYVGKLQRATFGRRYNKGYSHWIDGCIEHGARLFIGSVNQADSKYIESIESTIIQFLKPIKNHMRKLPKDKLHVTHKGQVPTYLQ